MHVPSIQLLCNLQYALSGSKHILNGMQANGPDKSNYIISQTHIDINQYLTMLKRLSQSAESHQSAEKNVSYFDINLFMMMMETCIQ